MAGLATKETNKSVSLFIDNIESESKKEDAKELLSLMEVITGVKPKIWGDNFIIGFGNYKYKRKNGKEEFEWFNVGFAPRKTKLTIYLTLDINQHEDLLNKLGKCKWGKGCLYINKLKDVDLDILKQLITRSKDAKWH
ncbi:DUF1801 domain-containing protein [uncultured Psychroserpens sp.]|uniref:DUF1801 domain-containing protein n=1 Tax=uncultured Psychroserpens sp. TaxID=255436 RepID=UPI00262B48D0|nr:DUF1801 domain-containing protein [uncultured Psychroserpens sp.]